MKLCSTYFIYLNIVEDTLTFASGHWTAHPRIGQPTSTLVLEAQSCMEASRVDHVCVKFGRDMSVPHRD